MNEEENELRELTILLNPQVQQQASPAPKMMLRI
jgi:hypothetical protein